jgi:hypothetical protein
MSSVKDSFSKGIGYIKRDLEILKEMKEEIQEFLGYYNTLPDLPQYRVRIAKEQERLNKINDGIFEVKQELTFYKDYFRYTQTEIDAIPAATEESIARDLKIQEQELKQNTWTDEDTKRVFAKAGIIIG